MPLKTTARAACFVLLGACTPLGLWIYEDPMVTVSRVTLELSERVGPISPVVVALAVHNRNDFPLTSTRIEVSLHLDGVFIGQLRQDRTVALPKAMISAVALPLRLEKQVTPSRLRALDSGSHKFAISGRATFETPFGTRKVRFAEEGEMTFGQRTSSSAD